jgi:hypothetical protein
MSIDVMILPGRQLSILPSALFAQLELVKGSRAAALVGASPALFELGTRGVIAGDAALEPGKTYAFRLAADNTLLLSIGRRTDFDEKAYVEDYGSELTPAQREAIIGAWRHAGPGLTLSSGAGRAAAELDVLAALALACARVAAGWISLESGAFVEPRPGIYTPEQLDGVQYRLAAGSGRSPQ